MQIKVIAATPDQEPVLANLIELYAHDFSEMADLELNSDGRFGYAPLPLYWQQPNRHPFLVTVDDRLAGFALVKQGSEISGNQNTWDVAEFFIVRRYRRHGVGKIAAHQIWRTFPGCWEVRVLERNQTGLAFWNRAIASFVGTPVAAAVSNINNKIWHVFSFDSANGNPN
ncbi:MAG: GNAT family N-acetyltransferase [Acidobacteria bacterium]|nr:GNAT family N-acetyltransferase [Acidobacteriota bacterium]